MEEKECGRIPLEAYKEEYCCLSSEDYEKECIKLRHELWLAKRTIEALEYALYKCIPDEDRHKN